MSQTREKMSVPIKRRSEQGGITILIASTTMFLALFAIFILQVGAVSREIDEERHLVDLHGKLVGQMAIRKGLNDTCSGGTLVGGSSQLSNRFESELNEAGVRRNYQCAVEGELVERRNGPDSQQGTFRRFRVSSSSDLDVSPGSTLNSDNPNAQQRHQEDEVIVEVREEQGRLEGHAKVVFVLDYSGSMNGDPLDQLKDGFLSIVGSNYPMDYGVILFSANIVDRTPIGSGPAHFRNTEDVVLRYDSQTSTKFTNPLREAIRLLKAEPGQDLFIILMSDGRPQDLNSAQSLIRREVHQAPRRACEGFGSGKCITVYTLAVDGAQRSALKSLSGNAVDPRGDDYNYRADSSQIRVAFEHILANILCKYGPLDPGPSAEEEDTLNVFINERPVSQREYEYLPRRRTIQFYKESPSCREFMRGSGEITIRYGKPRVYMEQP
ncbi:MAG: VWA domain-containing protein [Myxococcota bacterium]|nr:VWA domain-containing protein [Myxococcota bacterium]